VESARRGYVLTGDETQAERSRTTAAAVRGRVAELRRLTADNPRQQALLDRLEPLTVRRLAQIEESIEQRRRSPDDRAAQSAATMAGTRATDEIRGALGEMFEEERTLLGRRDAEVSGSLRRTRWVITLGSVSAGLLVGVASLLFTCESLQRQRAEREVRRREALYRAVLSQFPNGAVLLYDRDLRYRLAEGRGLEAVGCRSRGSRGERSGRPCPPRPPRPSSLDTAPPSPDRPAPSRCRSAVVTTSCTSAPSPAERTRAWPWP
jgi:CHASE3 domain sensor protein